MRARWVLLLAAALAVSCKRDGGSQGKEDAHGPVAAPTGLIAAGTLREPDAFWGRIRRGAGTALRSAPESAAGALLAWAGADPSLATLVSGSKPFHLALGDGADGVVYALAMHVTDADGVRVALVDGETARYRGEELEGMTRLVPREGPLSGPGIAITRSGWLVVASHPKDLETLGAYAWRTLPTEPLPTPGLELQMAPDALARAGRGAPAFSDKMAVFLASALRDVLPPEVDASAVAACFTPGVRDAVAAAGDLADARLEVDADEQGLDAHATMVPKVGDNAARRRVTAMRPADAAPMLDSPRETVAALLWSDTIDTRTDDAASLGPCLGKSLAPILGPNGSSKLADALAAWARGRGDWEAAAFVLRRSVTGMTVRTPVKDASSTSAAMRGFVDLASQPSVADALRRTLPLRAGQVQPADVPGVGKASILMFPSRPSAAHDDVDPTRASAELSPPGLAWAQRDDEVDVAVGQSPKDLLALTHPASTLRTIHGTEHAVKELAGEASFAAIVVPPGCCRSDAPAASPLTVGWGEHAGNARATLAIGDELLGQILLRGLGR
ncbi:MAG TPA: hypothetical protein VGG39_03855 [Polyangiaceae bacterium]